MITLIQPGGTVSFQGPPERCGNLGTEAVEKVMIAFACVCAKSACFWWSISQLPSELLLVDFVKGTLGFVKSNLFSLAAQLRHATRTKEIRLDLMA